MAGLSGPNPLSVGQFQQDGGAAGVQGGVNSVLSLGQAIAGNPAQIAQSRYLGAETARAGAQAQTLQQTLADGQQVTNLLSDWAKSPGNTDPVRAAAAIVARNPDIAARFPQMVATMGQLAAAGGQLPANLADTLTAGLGVAPAGSTFTGQGRELQKDRDVANIGAGATLGVGRMTADASMENERQRQAGEDRRNVKPIGNANDPNAPPTYATAVDAGRNHLPAYIEPVASTIAGKDHDYTDVMDPATGQVQRTTNANAARTSATIAAKSPAEVTANLGQRALVAPPGTPAPGLSQDETDMARVGVVAGSSGAKNDPTTAKDAEDMDTKINKGIQALKPRSWPMGGNTPDAALANVIRQQASWLYDHDPRTKNNMQAAVTQAILNVAGTKGENLGWKNNMMPLSGDVSHTTLAHPENVFYPPGSNLRPGQPQSQPPGQPAQPLGAAIAGTGGAPAAAPAPAPAPAGEGSPLAATMAAPPQAPAQAPAPAAAPPQAAAPAPQAANLQAVIAQAQAAIAKGANPTAVAQRLQQMGIDPSILRR